MPLSLHLSRGFIRATGFALACGFILSAAACTTARPPAPSASVLQEEKPEPLPPGIKPLTVEQAEQVGE
ncbi:hypothetical protein [Phyllobacterium myrsinacearum]|uniref:Uncharacterized protein n=1 Tax=Phyllobacterium myrsinacearum TaxID=28101 RepID=A0A839EF62_9HYPH|nr:hypothetical protein [Phyllobacterium myrsinacearum]MBA8877562.1 hypothetical protein [Phyllobacterium myrsinacearum]